MPNIQIKDGNIQINLLSFIESLKDNDLAEIGLHLLVSQPEVVKGLLDIITDGYTEDGAYSPSASDLKQYRDKLTSSMGTIEQGIIADLTKHLDWADRSKKELQDKNWDLTQENRMLKRRIKELEQPKEVDNA